MRYSYAHLGGIDFGFVRFGGTGLGNLLFPWARFIVATRKQGLIPIYPSWFQIKLGPLMRNEPDKRFYRNLFHPPPDHIFGFKKFRLFNTLKKIGETEFKLLREMQGVKSDFMVTFEGMTGQFMPILKDHELVSREFLAMTRDEQKKGLSASLHQTIGVHVRRGDFAQLKHTDVLEHGGVNCQIPLSWYISQIEQLRGAIGSDVSVNVFSDGMDEELLELLALKQVKRINFGSSVADLLALSQSGILVTSGSTFSMWASYLGRMPVIWHAGQLKQRLYYDNQELETETDKNGNLSSGFLGFFRKGLFYSEASKPVSVLK